MKKLFTLTGLLLLTIFLGACQAQNNATPSNQTATTSSTISESSSSSTTSTPSQTNPGSSPSSSDISNAAPSTVLDGTYVLERFDEVKTLTIKNGTGQLETKEYDGEIDIDPVKVNADKQIILIGDDMKTYQLDGNQLTLTEGDGDQDIYTKQ
nr:lipocalin/fatty acid-binding family protein [Streptococcus lutetiensis]